MTAPTIKEEQLEEDTPIINNKQYEAALKIKEEQLEDTPIINYKQCEAVSKIKVEQLEDTPIINYIQCEAVPKIKEEQLEAAPEIEDDQPKYKTYRRTFSARKSWDVPEFMQCWKKSKCEECGWCDYNLQKHKLTHQIKSDFKCEDCGKAFSSTKAVIRHRSYKKDYIRQGGNLYCIVCEGIFNTPCILRKHLYSKHAYVCCLCKRTFFGTSALRHHMQYQCSENKKKIDHDKTFDDNVFHQVSAVNGIVYDDVVEEYTEDSPTQFVSIKQMECKGLTFEAPATSQGESSKFSSQLVDINQKEPKVFTANGILYDGLPEDFIKPTPLEFVNVNEKGIKGVSFEAPTTSQSESSDFPCQFVDIDQKERKVFAVDGIMHDDVQKDDVPASLVEFVNVNKTGIKGLSFAAPAPSQSKPSKVSRPWRFC